MLFKQRNSTPDQNLVIMSIVKRIREIKIEIRANDTFLVSLKDSDANLLVSAVVFESLSA